MITLDDLSALKLSGEKFSCLTSYDATFARVIAQAGIETQLVGDSLGNVIQGHKTTVPVTVDEICYHTRNVTRGNTNSFILADMPFMSYAAPEQALRTATALMQAGAHCVKMEGATWLCDTVRLLSDRGIPVCTHLGLTPQSVHSLSGFRVQARDPEAAERLVAAAQAQVEAGARLLVLECVPAALAADLTQLLPIPVIGIGAGSATDGQVLVLHDMLGLVSGYSPKFVRNFLLETESNIAEAITAYHRAVKDQTFPGPEHSFA